MEYQELCNEYTSLLQEMTNCQDKLALLRNGYISTKTISGKKYAYLQYRVDGKLLSEYVKDESLPAIREELDKRAEMLIHIRGVKGKLGKIEAAAGILDESLYRKLITLRRCAVMDGMPLDERSKSLAFGSAMTALEGIPASEGIEKNLTRWADGDLSFRESYLSTLQAYHLAEV